MQVLHARHVRPAFACSEGHAASNRAAPRAACPALRAADTFVDFEAPPPIPEGALAPGTAKQTTLATCAPANTLLPEDLRYEVRVRGWRVGGWRLRV